MLTWFIANWGTLLVCAVVLLTAGAAARYLLRQKKSGHSVGCGCGCAGCPMSGQCHSVKTPDQT